MSLSSYPQVDPESGRGPLHFATELNNRDLVDFFISCGGHLDVADVRGLTPLHIASIIEGAESLEAIVRRVGGEDVLDIRDGQELTPLMHACLYGNITSVRLLLKKKVIICICHSSRKYQIVQDRSMLVSNPLNIVANNSQFEMAKLIFACLG